jgi:hypothetical protein
MDRQVILPSIPCAVRSQKTGTKNQDSSLLFRAICEPLFFSQNQQNYTEMLNHLIILHELKFKKHLPIYSIVLIDFNIFV